MTSIAATVLCSTFFVLALSAAFWLRHNEPIWSFLT